MAKPQIDYTAKDYDGFVSSMVENIQSLLPEWTSRTPSDPGMVLIELFAHAADILSYYGDRIANEAFLTTATQRSSVLDIAAMLDYVPAGNQAAQTVVTFTFEPGSGIVTVPADARVSTASAEAAVVGRDPVEFTLDEALVVDTAVTTQGSVAVTEGRWVLDEVLGTSDGEAKQQFTLFEPNVVDGTVQVYVDSGAGPEAWGYYRHLLDATSTAAAFTLYTDAEGFVYIVFGDGANGRIPPIGSDIIATYRIGAGADGNVGANTLVELVEPIPTVVAVTNPNGAVGGANPETLEDIKENAPRSLRAIDRTVTVQDYADLAVRSSYVGKAKASSDLYTNVLLYVAPRGTASGTVSSLNKTNLLNYLAGRMLVGTSITLADPTYVEIDVEVDVQAWSTFRQADVQRGVEQTLSTFFAYANVDFGLSISQGDILARLIDVPGVRYLDIRTLSRTGDLVLRNIALSDHEIPIAGTITVNVTGGIV
jgi:uncharacterized phage protein gp47/JayE